MFNSGLLFALTSYSYFHRVSLGVKQRARKAAINFAATHVVVLEVKQALAELAVASGPVPFPLWIKVIETTKDRFR